MFPPVRMTDHTIIDNPTDGADRDKTAHACRSQAPPSLWFPGCACNMGTRPYLVHADEML